ncbi:hypothetical protein M6D81_11930 [Paenibacillus sp. J5C_2022]|uniref:hypothetical protein n=1 Tax=Paenibacillus sp. J5C2022 TaxID=2977129 RepID=UPI0021D244BD|nr:hypothetical protein [Paenibacillus sp. J5C2022]MCU6709414.1 hypothetical protein [Paenibacillus sp. J5C2022]
MSTNQNFSLYAGDTLDIVVELDNVDLSAATIKWAMTTLNGNEYLIYKQTPEITVDEDNGLIIFRLESADTIDCLGDYYHECELTDGIGNVSTIMTGLVNMKRSRV